MFSIFSSCFILQITVVLVLESAGIYFTDNCFDLFSSKSNFISSSAWTISILSGLVTTVTLHTAILPIISFLAVIITAFSVFLIAFIFPFSISTFSGSLLVHSVTIPDVTISVSSGLSVLSNITSFLDNFIVWFSSSLSICSLQILSSNN